MDIVKNLFERLATEEDKLSVLLDGKAHLVNVNETTLKELISAQDLVVIFDCLWSQNEEQVSTAVFILKLLLPILDVEEKLQVLSELMQRGLDHTEKDVRQLCLMEFKACSLTDAGSRMLSSNEDVLCRIMRLVGEEDMSTALEASDVLFAYGASSLPAAKTLLTGRSLTTLKSVMKVSDSVRYRVYDIIVKIQSESEKFLHICEQSDILQELVKELNGDDVLIRVNCIASLSEMALTKHSLEYLKRTGVVDKLIQLISNADADPLYDLYMPEIVKFFGKMCYCEGAQNIVEIYPQFLPTLFSLLEDRDPVKRKVAMETIGFIGASVEGKCVLAKTGGKALTAIRRISSALAAEGDELRLVAVNTMSQLLHVGKEEQTEDVLELTVQWFQCISSDPIDVIISLCKQPFRAVKCAGFHLIKTLGQVEWGLVAMVEYPTFTEFLLDRTSDNDKESKEARHAAVKAVAESPHCKHIFGNNNWLRFQTFVREGPFYTESVLAVSYEEA